MAIDRESIVAQAERMQEAGLHEVAAGLYSKITDDAPDDMANAPVYVTIGDLLLLAGKRDDAITAYLKADQLHPSPDVRDKLDALIEEPVPVEEPVVKKKKQINLPNMPEMKMPVLNMPTQMPDAGESYNKFHAYVNSPQHAKLVVRIAIVMVLLMLLLWWAPWNLLFKKGGNWQPVTPQHNTAPRGITPGGR